MSDSAGPWAAGYVFTDGTEQPDAPDPSQESYLQQGEDAFYRYADYATSTLKGGYDDVASHVDTLNQDVHDLAQEGLGAGTVVGLAALAGLAWVATSPNVNKTIRAFLPRFGG